VAVSDRVNDRPSTPVDNIVDNVAMTVNSMGKAGG